MNNIKIWFDSDTIYLDDGVRGTASLPLNHFPKLMHSSNEERSEFELSPFGIHWPKLDEDLSFDGFYQPATV